jgi:hypothetical protein
LSKAIPASCENSRPLELVFGLELILKLTPGQAAAFQINFVSASADLAVIYRVVRRGIFCASLNGACVKLQGLTFLLFDVIRVLSFRSRWFSISGCTPGHLRATGPDGGVGARGYNDGIAGSKRKTMPAEGWVVGRSHRSLVQPGQGPGRLGHRFHGDHHDRKNHCN